MSESDSFIREVSEEVRRDRFSAMLRRYGWIAALVILVIVAGAGINEWLNARDRASAEAAGERLRAAFLVDDPGERAAALAESADAVGDARPVALIAQAGALLDAGERQASAEILASVSENASFSPIYRDLALLQRVAVLGPEMDRTERFAAIETLSRPDGPFRLLALEQRAVARLEAGELDQARADLEAILADPALPEGLASRARQLLIAAGGEVPAPAGSVLEEAAQPGAAPAPVDEAPLPGADG